MAACRQHVIFRRVLYTMGVGAGLQMRAKWNRQLLWGTVQISTSLHTNKVLIAPFDHGPSLQSLRTNVLCALNHKTNAALLLSTACRFL